MHMPATNDIINFILFCNAPDPILILDSMGTIKDCNGALEEVYAYPRDELIGKKSIDFLTEESKAVFKEKFPALKNGSLQEGEVEVVSKEGKIIHLWRKGIPIMDDVNGFGGAVIFDRDITLKKLTEKELREQKEYLERRFEEQTSRIQSTNQELQTLIGELKKTKEKNLSILHALPDLLFILNKDGEFLDYNYDEPGGLYVMPEMFIGKKLMDVLPSGVAELSFSMVQKTLKTRELQTFEYELDMEGDRTSFEARMVYKNASEVLVIIRDITEQKRTLENLNKSETLFRTLVNSTQEAVIAINSKSEIVIFNPAAEKMFQLSIDELQAGNISKIFPDDYKVEHGKWVSGYFKSGKPDGAMGKTMELRARRNDGSSFDIEISISPGDLEDERIVVAVIRDITLRKKAEKALLEAKEKAVENDRLKSAFLANMSHEIRTPMNSILGFSNLLPEAETEKERDDYIKIIISNGHLLMNLINDIIDISKIEAGLTKSFNTSFHISDKMENIYDLFSVNEKCVSGKVELKMNVPPELKNETLFTDKTKFSQILINLVNNAIKFTEEGVVEFGFSKVEIDGKPIIRFYVKDSGIGISKSDQELIFDRFRQVDVIDRNAYGGTGLGLSICKSFAKLLGGDIQVESEEGKGTVFFVSLPARAAGAPLPKVISKHGFTGFSNWQGKKILVVEDNDANYMIFNAYLKETGLELLWAKTGEEAVEYCERNDAIDLILMDIKLPGMDGYEATKRIRGIGKKTPIIAQTAYAMDSDRQRSVDAGCDNFISKPILKEKLYNILSNYLN